MGLYPLSLGTALATYRLRGPSAAESPFPSDLVPRKVVIIVIVTSDCIPNFNFHLFHKFRRPDSLDEGIPRIAGELRKQPHRGGWRTLRCNCMTDSHKTEEGQARAFRERPIHLER